MASDVEKQQVIATHSLEAQQEGRWTAEPSDFILHILILNGIHVWRFTVLQCGLGKWLICAVRDKQELSLSIQFILDYFFFLCRKQCTFNVFKCCFCMTYYLKELLFRL